MYLSSCKQRWYLFYFLWTESQRYPWKNLNITPQCKEQILLLEDAELTNSWKSHSIVKHCTEASQGNPASGQQNFFWSSALPVQLSLASRLTHWLLLEDTGTHRLIFRTSLHIYNSALAETEGRQRPHTSSALPQVTPECKRPSWTSFPAPITAKYNLTRSPLPPDYAKRSIQAGRLEAKPAKPRRSLRAPFAGSVTVLCSGRWELFKCFDRTCRFLGNVFILVNVPILHRFPVESRQTVWVWVSWNKTISPRKKNAAFPDYI